MSKYSKDEIERIIRNLKQSIPLVPIELQLMYLYNLINNLFCFIDDDGVHYTSFSNTMEIVPTIYYDTLLSLKDYRNAMAHEGVYVTFEHYKKLCENRFEVDMLATMCNVSLNWDNSLNLV